MIDKRFVGLDLGSHEVQLEKGALKFFATAIGQENSVYFDEKAAAEAGYPGLPVPPSYYFSLDMFQDEPFGYFDTLGVDLNHVLHGAQDFEYFKPAFAGETVVLKAKIVDLFDKKNGALDFIIKEVRVENKAGDLLAKQVMTIIVRNPEGRA
ncbi:MAG: MaoC family dehydratase N-terminal domain-containing protein [Emcibacter sp.]|nr:MaoC family dehydratase N-terminal domain-containing protein [Emcibacter sp.]